METALVKYACPICGKECDSAIVLPKYINSKKNDKEIREMHGKIVGYADKPCKECQDAMKQGILFVGVIEEKSEPNNPYRSGYTACVKDDCEFIASINEPQRSEILAKRVCFIDQKFGEQIGLFNTNN